MFHIIVETIVLSKLICYFSLFNEINLNAENIVKTISVIVDQVEKDVEFLFALVLV
jgi:hypothetical protein